LARRRWRSIEVTTDDVGAPSVLLHAPATEIARAAGVGTLHLSMTHTNEMAAAFVVGAALEDEFNVR